MSQPDTIVIADKDAVDHNYTRDEVVVNKTTYISSDEHVLDDRQQMQFYRTRAKRNGNSRGSSKVAVKLTDDVAVLNVAGDGNNVLPAILEISASLPLGISDAERQDLIARGAQLLSGTTTPATVFEMLTKLLSI
jgi:S1-C subfamily serine protease